MKKKLMRWLSRFAMGLALFTFIVICNFILFFSYERQGDLNGDYGTVIVIGNIIFLAVLFTIADSVYHYVTVKRPMKRIQKELDKVVAGIFQRGLIISKGRKAATKLMRLSHFLMI